MRHAEHAPAKLNLSLRVLGKRDDGFHAIETLMVAVDGVGDEIEFELREGAGVVTLSCDDPELPTGEDNLVLRAVAEFERATGLRFDGRIDLKKRTPPGAGLGGGSSDAAATLRALDAISGAGLGAAGLCELAKVIGSDVAFFVNGRPAWCRGRGEEVEPFGDPVPATAVVLAKPEFGVSSGWAYQRWAVSAELDGVSYAAQPAPWGEAVNDLERPVFEKYLALPALKSWLSEQPETGVSLMSGSGSTVFATLANGGDGSALLDRLSGEFGETTWARLAKIGGEE